MFLPSAIRLRLNPAETHPQPAPPRPPLRAFRRIEVLFLTALSLLASACGPAKTLVFLDPALPWVDPEGTAAYRSFRMGLGKAISFEIPGDRTQDFLWSIAEEYKPDQILLSPLLASEYPEIREVFPKAWILGLGLPPGDRTITASWDPEPSAREAGRRAGVFLGGSPRGPEEEPEVVLVAIEGQGDLAQKAFLGGLREAFPGARCETLSLQDSPTPESIDSMIQHLSSAGARVLFLDAGEYGLRLARGLAARRRPGAQETKWHPEAFLVLRRPDRTAPGDAPADIVLSGDTKALLGTLKGALRRKRALSIEVPEALNARTPRAP